MKTLYLDIETYSSSDLGACGVYRYSEAPDFEILLIGYSVNGGEVCVIDLASGGTLPDDIRMALLDKNVIKYAHNAQFERVCLSRWLGVNFLDPSSWRCTMVWAAYLGLPLSLEQAGIVMKVEKQKLSEGKELIKYFCSPCKPTNANGRRIRNLPKHAPDKWERFKSYNKRDVETEVEMVNKLSMFPLPKKEWQYYILDQKINDMGIMLDMDLVREAIRFDEYSNAKLIKALKNITGLDNPNSVVQMKTWLLNNGLDLKTLGKMAVNEIINEVPENIKNVLRLRQSLAKSSVKKYKAMENAVCRDQRVRGLLQFYGANRTGRFAGRLVQVQNLPQNHLPDLLQARNLVKMGNIQALELLYDSIPFVLSELIRTAFIPRPGYKFIVADFSAIEARVISWLAGETWRNEVFATHGKIYEASASQMFRVPIEEITKGSLLRQKGKIAELALGYGGSVGALKAMGALQMGLSEDELQPLVTAWRMANPNIVKLWWAVDNAVKTSVLEQTNIRIHGLQFEYTKGFLFIELPSGRRLAYVKPQIDMNHFGNSVVTYEGIGTDKKWKRIESYGPKFVENIVQAISRDILCHALECLNNLGYSIVMHVHDEVVVETSQDISVEMICRHMSKAPVWAKDLVLKADGFECQFYKKE